MDKRSVIERLFVDGNFELILIRIFSCLDGRSLEACSLVSKSWRSIIKGIFKRQSTQVQLRLSWKSGVATSHRIHLGDRLLSVRVDSTSILVGTENGKVELWERVGKQESAAAKGPSRRRPVSPFRRIGPLVGHTDLVRSVDLSPSWLVSGSWDSGIRLWRRDNGQLLASSYHHAGPVTHVSINEKGRFVLSASRDGTVRKVAIVELPGEDHFALHSYDLYCLDHGDSIIDMSVDGSFAITGGSDAKLLLWKTDQEDREEQLQRVLTGHENAIRCCFLKFPLAISGSRDKTARLWDVEKGLQLRVLTHTIDVRAVTFNSYMVFTGDDYSDFFVWDRESCLDQNIKDGQTDKLLSRTLTGHNGLVHSILCTPTSLISCDVTGLVIERDFWNCISEKESLRILHCAEGVNCMTCDNEEIVCGLLSKVVSIYNRKTLTLVRKLTGHTDHIWSIDMNKKHLVTGSWDATVKIWNRSDGKLLHTYHNPHSKEISGVRIIRDRIYISCLSGSLTILSDDDKIGFEVIRLIPNLGEIYSMSGNDNFLLTGHTSSKTSVQLWSIDDEQKLSSEVIIKEENSESIIWNLHMCYPLALVCRDNSLLDVFHLKSQTCLKHLKHESKVLNATLFRDIIVTGCQYGLLVFWDLTECLKAPEKVLDFNHVSCLRILSEHSGAISNVFIDSNELITDDYDGIVILRKICSHSDLQTIFSGR